MPNSSVSPAWLRGPLRSPPPRPPGLSIDWCHPSLLAVLSLLLTLMCDCLALRLGIWHLLTPKDPSSGRNWVYFVNAQ